MNTLRLARCALVLAPIINLGLTGCGRPEAPSFGDVSELEWTQSRSGSTRYAYLQAADLSDDFLFGASVIKVDGFLSDSLNMVLHPLKVKLKVRTSGSSRKLDIVTAGTSGDTLMTFAVATKTGKYEVDFASAGNDLTLKTLINTLGGEFTAGSQDGYWVSQGTPSVQSISQDADTVVVDLLHTVSQAVLKTDAQGRQTIDHLVSARPGKVTVRLFLKRQKVLPRIGGARFVSAGKQRSIGYFGPDMGGSSDDVAIQRFALGDAQDAQSSITFYLKDVPTAYQGIAKQAVLSWNKAFDNEVIKVALAPAGVDVGDPRANVIKWFDGLDEDVSWAGVAKMIVEPESGLVMGGDLYVNGSTVLNMYKGIVDFSQKIGADAHAVTGTIGNVRFDRDVGEKPVMPFVTDLSQNYDSYMQQYYLETIAHEVGHVLGLRHNFRGSAALEGGESASVMDYAPRSDRAHYKGPGSYDVAAIRWGYTGEEPAAPLPFCTDEDIWSFYDCSQGDWGDPIDYAVKGLLDGTALLTRKAVALTDDNDISSMGGILENALKIKKLSAQIPAARRTAALQQINAAYQNLYNAAPDATLTGANLTLVKGNLTKLRDLAKKTEAQLRTDGHL